MRRTTGWAVAGFAGGFAAGLVLWSGAMHRSRRELFDNRPLRRLAALGYLRGQPCASTARLLADYVAWERHPGLRRRGEQLLRRMAHHLDQDTT